MERHWDRQQILLNIVDTIARENGGLWTDRRGNVHRRDDVAIGFISTVGEIVARSARRGTHVRGGGRRKGGGQ